MIRAYSDNQGAARMEIRTLNDIYTVTCTLARPAALKYK